MTNVILIPGFGEYPETKTFQTLAEQLKSANYNVTTLAWPHYPENLADYSISATLEAGRTLLSRLHISGEKYILHANSMGGIIAIILAAEFHPEKVSLTVSPFQAGTNDDLAGKYKEWKETGYRTFTSSKYGELQIPFTFIEDARQYNALDYIKRVTCPISFIAGELDQNVPWTSTRRLYDQANEPKNWHLIEGMEHRFQYQEEKLQLVNELIINFIQN